MSTPSQKAKKIVSKMQSIIWDENKSEAKYCALIAINEIEDALFYYGKESMELQNMDSYFRYWDKVKEEIKKL